MDGPIALVDDEITWCRLLAKSVAKGDYQVEAFKTMESLVAVMVQI
jgi:ActR/RegA family two-component response regulator